MGALAEGGDTHRAAVSVDAVKLPAVPGHVNAVAALDGGRVLVSIAQGTSSWLKVIDVTTGRTIRATAAGQAVALHVSADGRTFLAAGKTIEIRRISDLGLLHRFRVGRPYSAIGVSSSLDRIAVGRILPGDLKGQVAVYNTTTGRRVWARRTTFVDSLAFTSDSGLVYCGCPWQASLMDARTGRTVASEILGEEGGSAYGVAALPDGRLAVGGGRPEDEGFLMLITPSARPVVKTLSNDEIRRISVARRGGIFVVYGGGYNEHGEPVGGENLWVRSAADGKVLGSVPLAEGLDQLAVTPDGSVVAGTTRKAGRLVVWQITAK